MNDVTWILIGAAVSYGIMLTYNIIMILCAKKPKPVPVRVFNDIDGGPKA